jgi:hypothetical protein
VETASAGSAPPLVNLVVDMKAFINMSKMSPERQKFAPTGNQVHSYIKPFKNGIDRERAREAGLV